MILQKLNAFPDIDDV